METIERKPKTKKEDAAWVDQIKNPAYKDRIALIPSRKPGLRYLVGK